MKPFLVIRLLGIHSRNRVGRPEYQILVVAAGDWCLDRSRPRTKSDIVPKSKWNDMNQIVKANTLGDDMGLCTFG